MTIEQTDTIDFVTIKQDSGDVWLSISDHLPWDIGEGDHLLLLQGKLNAYLRFIESGELVSKIPQAKERSVIIDLVGKFPLNKGAARFFEMSKSAIKKAGIRLQFRLLAAGDA
jgi:hypothetical protein